MKKSELPEDDVVYLVGHHFFARRVGTLLIFITVVPTK